MSSALAGMGTLTPMPPDSIRTMAPMRDGVRLETRVWLPQEARQAPVPAIFTRGPYREEVIGWARLGQMRYVERGYALVWQMIRGTGRSEGVFSFNAPHEKCDGYDSVEWIAAQPWCDGRIGMDGSSYLAMTQLSAAAARPPHLVCIAPHVPCADFFREFPYFGGAFTRQHSLNWTNLVAATAPEQLTGGFLDTMPILSQPDWLRRMTSRPAVSAAEGLLTGDKLAHYRDVLSHSTFDDWWAERHLTEQDYAAMDLPMLLVTGNFDMSIGAMTVWAGCERHAPERADRQLLVGPWDHRQAYLGASGTYGPFDLGPDASGDPFPTRLAFFDLHLKGRGAGPQLNGKARIFFTGANAYRSFDAYPPAEVKQEPLFLSSAGEARGLRGAGALSPKAPEKTRGNTMRSDPRLPFVPGMTSALGLTLDLREQAAHGETLVYLLDRQDEPLTIVGEPEVIFFVAATTRDADVGVQLAEVREDGMVAGLARHMLRLRYHRGFDREVALEPGVPVEARIKLTFVAHTMAPSARLALLVQPDMFPFIDPNPNTGEPIATAMNMTLTEVTLLSGEAYPSRLVLPVLRS